MNQIENYALWAGFGCLCTLLGAWIAHTNGWIQIRIMAQAHELNIAKAAPKIGTTVRLEKREIPSHSVWIFHVVTSIYNEGDLAASKLKGDWKLSCSESVLNRTVSISLDHLGQSRPYNTEVQFGSVKEWRDVGSGKDLGIEVDINFSYFGLDENGEQKYEAKYRYKPQQQQFVRCD